jgi:hypothetical protein
MSNKVAGEADMDVTANWYWEGNVSRPLPASLRRTVNR